MHVIPIRGDIWPKEDGSWDWEFTLLGSFRYPDDAPATPLFLVHYDYFNEAVIGWAKNQVGWLAVRVRDPASIEATAATIDTLFENSQNPTRSTTEDEYRRQYANQLGDMGFITTMILGAVFFTIILLTGNTASQAFNERIGELAILKTLGFTDAKVAALVLGEAVALCVAGAAAGIGLALAVEPGLNRDLGGLIGSFEVTWQSSATAVGLSVLLGFAIGAHPAWAARKLTIVEALRES